MWPYHEELLARPVPRYTSYPTAAEFSEGIGHDEHARALLDIPKGSDVSLYVHIPFCEEICWYCGCNTARSNKAARLTAYLEALHDEINLVSSMLAGHMNVKRISIGGGSPNALTAVDFARIIDRFTINFSAPDPLISIEIDPRHFSVEWLRAIASIHVSNVSLGVQTFDPIVQNAIGRVQPHDVVAELVEELRLAGVVSINFDLMYGLPGQHAQSLRDTIEKAIILRPERIALFGYAHLPHLLPRQRRIDDSDLPQIRERFLLAQQGYDMLCRAGYQPVGFDHFALPDDPLACAAREGKLHRNFQGFTDDEAPFLIGFGASAISRLPGLFAQNAKKAGTYRGAIAEGRLSTERGVSLTKEDVSIAGTIEDILCKGEAEIALQLTSGQRQYLEHLGSMGMVAMQGGRLKLAADARPYARSLAAAFDAYRPMSRGQFSSAI